MLLLPFVALRVILMLPFVVLAERVQIPLERDAHSEIDGTLILL